VSVSADRTSTAAAGVEVRLLGAFSVTVSGTAVDPRAWRLAKAQHIVKLLALTPRHRLHRDELIELLWPDREIRSAANNLYQALSAVRRAIGTAGGDGHDVVRLEDEWVRLAPASGLWVDVEAFEAAARCDTTEDLRAGLALYQGDLLADDRYDEWYAARREVLARARNDMLGRLAQHRLDAGDLTEARGLLERLLEVDPANESAHQALMRIHAYSGSRAAAQQQFAALERALRDRLDMEPSAESRRLLDQIRAGQLTPPGRPRAPAATSPPEQRSPSTTVPTALSSFIGRERELAELRTAISRRRLVTLTGPGGCGKTRLATEVASACSDAFREGVYMVELGPLTPGSRVDLETARTLGVRRADQPSVVRAIADRIGSGRVLLLLDNCEHLIDASARMVETLLAACPRLVVLATSREPLRVPGEWVRRVASLRLPDVRNLPVPDELVRYDAVRLLVDRVSAACPDFHLDESNAATAALVCVRLDGLPLALELAAARVPSLGLAGVAEGLDDRFHLLTSGHRTGMTRHQTLEAAIGWSFALLPDEQRDLVCRLSSFRDSFDVPAATAVSGTATAGPATMAARLADLSERSMIVAEPSADRPRFRLLETVREYAFAALQHRGTLEDALDAHAGWFGALIDHAAGELTGPRHHEWLARLDESRTDLRVALARLRETDPAEEVRLVAAMWPYWLWFGYLDEGVQELEQALALDENPSEARSACWLGVFALHSRWSGGRTPGMQHYLDNALAEARAIDSAGAESRALLFDGVFHSFIDLDPSASAGERFRCAEQVAAAAGLVTDHVSALHARAVLAAHCCQYTLACDLLRHARSLLASAPRPAGDVLMLPACPVAMTRRLGTRWLVWEETFMPHVTTSGRSAEAYLEANLGSVARAVRDHDAARHHFEASLATYRNEGDGSGEALVLSRLGWLALDGGDLERARGWMEEALAAYKNVGDVRGRHMMMLGLSRVAIESGAHSQARSLLGAVLRGAVEQSDQPAVLAALDVRGALEVAVGDAEAAITALREALVIVSVAGFHRTAAVVSLDLADALRRAGRMTEAVEPATAALTVFETLGYDQAAARCRDVISEATY
jgi:predicted ATPase/DNA-binding SARP family transcriptional activator